MTRQDYSAHANAPTRRGQNGDGVVVGTNTHTSSGRVAGAAGAGVTLALSGAQVALSVTDANGDFHFEGLGDGTYAVTPQKDGYRFQPFFVAFTIAGQNVGEQNFLSWPDPIAHGIFGTVKGDSGLDVTLTLTGPLDAIENTAGAADFGFTGLPDGRYQLTPSRPGCSFDPESLDLIVNGADLQGVTVTAKAN